MDDGRTSMQRGGMLLLLPSFLSFHCPSVAAPSLYLQLHLLTVTLCLGLTEQWGAYLAFSAVLQGLCCAYLLASRLRVRTLEPVVLLFAVEVDT